MPYGSRKRRNKTGGNLIHYNSSFVAHVSVMNGICFHYAGLVLECCTLFNLRFYNTIIY